MLSFSASARRFARGAPRLPFFVLPGTLLLYFWRFGYQYGAGDQDELLPYLFRLLDPNLFGEDWFVQTQVEQFSVRAYFVLVLRGLAFLFPVWLGTLVLYVALWLLIALGVYRLALALVPDETAAALAVPACLVPTAFWTLGGNELVYNALVPEMAGWALALPALLAGARGRPLRAGLLLGVAAWFHALVGLLTAAALGACLLLDAGARRRLSAFRRPLLFGGIFLLAALPALVPLVLQQTQALRTPAAEEPSLFYILARFRNPHHYLPSAFGPAEWLRFGFLLLAGGLAGQALHRKKRLGHGGFVLRFTGFVLGACLLGAWFTEGVPVLLAAKLQVFKLTVLLKTGLVILCTAWVVDALPARLHTLLNQALQRRRTGLVLAAALWTVTLALVFTGTGRPYRVAHPLVHARSPLGAVEVWARTDTPANALFAVPPSLTSFRSGARRAVVVNFKAFPFEDDAMRAWFERLIDLAPLSLPETGLGVGPALDAAYHARTAADWQRLARSYGIDYLLLQDRTLPFPVAFRSGPWTVYQPSGRLDFGF